VRTLRAAAWGAGVPLRGLLLALIRAYRLVLSGSLGGQCKFHPTCSHYAEEAIRVHGALRGSIMAAWRILRCGPFTDGGVDHVAPRRGGHGQYDAVIRSRAAS
jgi:putative membrane protein insertion efficiency factor